MFEYICDGCDAHFELSELRVSAVRCPECLSVNAFALDEYFPANTWEWDESLEDEELSQGSGYDFE